MGANDGLMAKVVTEVLVTKLGYDEWNKYYSCMAVCREYHPTTGEMVAGNTLTLVVKLYNLNNIKLISVFSHQKAEWTDILSYNNDINYSDFELIEHAARVIYPQICMGAIEIKDYFVSNLITSVSNLKLN